MFDFHEKRKIQRVLFSKPVIGLIFLIAVLLSFSVYDRYVVSKEMQAKLDARYAELKALELRAETLDTKVRYLEDERGVEEELRNRFDVAKEGEQVIILLDERSEKVVDVPQDILEVSNEDKNSFWSIFKFW